MIPTLLITEVAQYSNDGCHRDNRHRIPEVTLRLSHSKLQTDRRFVQPVLAGKTRGAGNAIKDAEVEERERQW